MSCSYLDSKRLKETFFTQPKPQTNTKKKFAGIIAVVSFLLIIFLLHYDLAITPRWHLKSHKNTVSLLTPRIISSLSFTGKNPASMKRKNSSLYLSIPENEKAGVTLNFKMPIDLHNKRLELWLKNPGVTPDVSAVFKDTNFFSNATQPLLISTNKKDSSPYLKIPINIDNSILPRLNLHKIEQLRLHFSWKPKNRLEAPISGIDNKRKIWVIIKNIFVILKEEE